MDSGDELVNPSVIDHFFKTVNANHPSLNRIVLQENTNKGLIQFFYDRLKDRIYPEYESLDSRGMTPIRTKEEFTELMERVEAYVGNCSHKELKKMHGIDKAKAEIIVGAVVDLFRDFVNERQEAINETVQEEIYDKHEEDDEETDADHALEDTLATDSHFQVHNALSGKRINSLFTDRSLRNQKTPIQVNSQTVRGRKPAAGMITATRRTPAIPKESASTNVTNKLKIIRQKDPKVSRTLLSPIIAPEKRRDTEVYQVIVCRVTETGEPNITTHRVPAGTYTLGLPNNAVSLNDILADLISVFYYAVLCETNRFTVRYCQYLFERFHECR
jgi:hypothetical protein